MLCSIVCLSFNVRSQLFSEIFINSYFAIIAQTFHVEQRINCTWLIGTHDISGQKKHIYEFTAIEGDKISDTKIMDIDYYSPKVITLPTSQGYEVYLLGGYQDSDSSKFMADCFQNTQRHK